MPQQIEQPMATELTGKMLCCQVSAAVRLQAATRGLLARRWVRKMHDMPLIQQCTYLQLHHVEDYDLIRCIGDFHNAVPLTSSVHAVFSCRWWRQSLRRLVRSPMLFYVQCRLPAIQRGEGMVSSVEAHCLAPPDFATDHREGAFAGRSCNHFLEATHKHIFHPHSLHGIQVDGVRLMCRG